MLHTYKQCLVSTQYSNTAVDYPQLFQVGCRMKQTSPPATHFSCSFDAPQTTNPSTDTTTRCIRNGKSWNLDSFMLFHKSFYMLQPKMFQAIHKHLKKRGTTREWLVIIITSSHLGCQNDLLHTTSSFVPLSASASRRAAKSTTIIHSRTFFNVSLTKGERHKYL